MRLIDADALLDKYILNRDKSNILTAQTDYAQGARDIIEDIIDAPTIWPEQKKGKWISNITGIVCSNCYYKLETTGLLSECPNCGAKMDER